jgi:hypothetical protein
VSFIDPPYLTIPSKYTVKCYSKLSEGSQAIDLIVRLLPRELQLNIESFPPEYISKLSAKIDISRTFKRFLTSIMQVYPLLADRPQLFCLDEDEYEMNATSMNTVARIRIVRPGKTRGKVYTVLSESDWEECMEYCERMPEGCTYDCFLYAYV